MKKLFLSIALIFISLFAFSQNSPEQITDKFFQDLVKETPRENHRQSLPQYALGQQY